MKTGIVAHVDEVGLGAAQTSAEGNSFINSLMRRMLILPQSIDNEHIQSPEQVLLTIWQVFHVGNIANVPDTKPQYGQLTMHHLKGRHGNITDLQAVMRVYPLQFQLGNAGIDISQEAIWQALFQVGGGVVIGIERQFFAVTEWSEIVDASHMIVMLMGDQARVDVTLHAYSQHLLAKIGTAIYQHTTARGLNQSGGA